MPSRDVQPIENICLMKLFLGNVSQIDQVVKQGTVIRLVFEGSQGIVDAIQELTGLGQPFQTKLKTTILHADFCIDPAQYSVKLSQREIELSGHGFELTFGLPKNVLRVVSDSHSYIFMCFFVLTTKFYKGFFGYLIVIIHKAVKMFDNCKLS